MRLTKSSSKKPMAKKIPTEMKLAYTKEVKPVQRGSFKKVSATDDKPGSNRNSKTRLPVLQWQNHNDNLPATATARKGFAEMFDQLRPAVKKVRKMPSALKLGRTRKNLPVKTVVAIKEALANPGTKTQTEIARMYGVSVMTISRIKNGGSGKHVKITNTGTGQRVRLQQTNQLSIEQVKEIKGLLRHGKLSQKEIAAKYKVNIMMISRIYTRWVLNDGQGTNRVNSGTRTRLTALEKQQLVRLYENPGDKSRAEIAELFGFNDPCNLGRLVSRKVSKEKKGMGSKKLVEYSNVRIMQQEVAYIKALLKNPGRHTKKDIAVMFGVSIGVINRVESRDSGQIETYKNIRDILAKKGVDEAKRIIRRIKTLSDNPLGPPIKVITQIFGLGRSLISDIKKGKYYV